MRELAAAELPRRTRALAYIIGAYGLAMGNSINFLVPLRARELGATFDVIGVIVAAGALVSMLSAVPLGTVIDRIGAKRGFVLGTSLFAVAALAATAVSDYRVLLVVQMALGATRTTAWIASQAYVTHLGQASDRASLTGRFSFFSNVGTTLAPLITGFVAEWIGFRLAFSFLAVYGLGFCAVGAMLSNVDTSAGGTPRGGAARGGGFTAAGKLLMARGMQVALLLTAVRLWMSYTWGTFFPVHMVDVGIGAGIAGSVVAANGLVATMVAPSAGFWCRFARPPTVAVMGLVAGAVGLAVSPIVAVVPLVYLSAVLMGVASGLSLPLLLTIVSDAAPGAQRGTALGLRQVANNVAATGAPLIVGPLVTVAGATVAFVVGGGIAAAVLVLAAALSSVGQRSAAGRY